MSMKFRYRLFRTAQAVLSLGGRWVRPRPIIRVAVIGPRATEFREALLDNGSDDTVFHESVAVRIGIDLTSAPTGEASGAGGQPVRLRYAEVRLRISDGLEHREWTAWVGFTNVPLRRSLLGFGGFLQFFTAVSKGDHEEVELTINSLCRGT